MKIEEVLAELEGRQNNVRFSRLLVICGHFFGKPRIAGSHHFFRTPWPGNPRINIQGKGGSSKPYQVRQVIEALKKLQSLSK